MVSIAIEPGSRLGKYEVKEHLANGGMGSVYKAVDRELGRLAALKVLSEQLAENHLAIERFRREARHAARLNHPNIVTLFEFGRVADLNLCFLAFEFIDGIDLAKYLNTRGTLTPDEARRILVQVVKALCHAYEHGVVHRDIKPSNIMLARVGGKVRVKLTDLGLAITRGENDYRVTREGNTVGTIDYLAPEQARDSRAVDTRSDIYSLGCTAYHMLAGKAPFAEGGLGERLFRHLEEPPTDIRRFNPAVSAGFWAILDKMLAKSPEDRYTNPGEVLRALRRVNPSSAKRRSAQAPINSGKRHTEFSSGEQTRLSISQKPAAPEISKTAVSTPVVSKEQAQAAATSCQRAIEVLTQGGGEDYARQLLVDCLKLDPFNVAGRKALRALNQKQAAGVLGRWFGSFNVLAIKSKMRLARSTGDWRKVFEHGEDLLAHEPADADTHIEMAETATELGIPELARWLLVQGCQTAEGKPQQGELLRALARLHEHLREWKAAVAQWQRVLLMDPNDVEAGRKVKDLTAQDLVASGHYGQKI